MIQTQLFSTEKYIQKDIKQNKVVRSPLFYVGDKYKLMPQLRTMFPDKIKTFYDVFCGGGSASININAQRYVLNDSDKKVIELHKYLKSSSVRIDDFIIQMHRLIKKYGLSLSESEKNLQIAELKKTYKKTYFSIYNKKSYLQLRKDYNKNQSDTNLLYLLLVYGFNHMIRFNSKGEFNLPVGNVDWNKNVTEALKNYSFWVNNNDVSISDGSDFEDFVRSANISTGDFLYFDPPYLITFSDYNKNWNEEEERRLYNLLDDLDKKGIKWGLSNMVYHKNRQNNILLDWAIKYKKFDVKSNYISRFDNTIKKDSKEIYVTNI